MATVLERVLGAVGRAVAPVLFDPKKRFKFTFKDPVDPRLNAWANRANLVASQIQERLANEGISVLTNIIELQDDLTDILGTVRVTKEVKVIDQAQEILDLPLTAFLEGWIKTLKVVEDSNIQVIKVLRKRRTKKK